MKSSYQSLLVISLLAILLPCNHGHSAMFSRSRRQFESSLDQPFSQRKDSDTHAQISGNQSVIIKWCSSHFYNYYVSVIPVSASTHLFGSGKKAPLNEYKTILEDYFRSAPFGSNTAPENPRVHGVFRSPTAVNGQYLPNCAPGNCPQTLDYYAQDLFSHRIYPGDPGWASHAKEPATGLLGYKAKYTDTDIRVAYDNSAYPWLRSAARFTNRANLHSEYDMIEVQIPQRPDDGQHYVIHWFADMGVESVFYSDAVDVMVHSEPVDEAIKYGNGGGSYELNKLDHCQYEGYRRTLTPIRNATSSVAPCALDLKALDNLMPVLVGGGAGQANRGKVGINVVPLGNPELVQNTVKRAIESVNRLCVAVCDPDLGDQNGRGRCRQHDNTNGVDVCWAHQVDSQGVEYCLPGTGALLSEAIPAYLCPDSSEQGIIGTVVDTTIPNTPYTSPVGAAADPRSYDPNPNWLRLYGVERLSDPDWTTWEADRHDGRKCIPRVDLRWRLQELTLRDAVETCAANYPEHCGGISWFHNGLPHANLYTGKHMFALCLYEDLVNTTFWVGNNDPVGAGGVGSKTIPCPYCVSCSAILKSPANAIGIMEPAPGHSSFFSQFNFDSSFTNRGQGDATFTASRTGEWSGFTVKCRTSNSKDITAGLVEDSGWTTFTKPDRMTAPFERSFAGPFIGEDAASKSNTDAATKWVTWANVTFQKNIGLAWSNGDAAYAGDCADLDDNGDFMGKGGNAKCSSMERFGYCTADGNYGWKWAAEGITEDFASTLARNSAGSRMDEACCVCGGGKEVAVEWMRDLGEVYTNHSDAGLERSYGWRCPVPNIHGNSLSKRDRDDGYITEDFQTCVDGTPNDWNIEVPYKGAYLVSMYLTKRPGYSTFGLALENVRMRTSQYNQGGGITETIMVDVFDGQLTLSQYLPAGSNAPNWIKIEALASFEDISNEPISWAPTSTNAFWELELAESEEIGLVVLAPLHTNKMSADAESYGSSRALPNWMFLGDDDHRHEWLFQPPGESMGTTWVYKYGPWPSLRDSFDEFGYPEEACAYNNQHGHISGTIDAFDIFCYSTPSSSELNEYWATAIDWDQRRTRWWGHTGGRPGRGAVVSVSDTSCADPDANCGGEVGEAPGETVCEVLVRPQNCVDSPNVAQGTSRSMCPHEIDCKGAKGKFLRVRLPGRTRAISLDYVDAYRTRPKHAKVKTEATDPKRDLSCYSIESHEPPAPLSADFLEEIKVLNYQISLDPTDPIFYSTCFTYEAIPEWLPLESETIDTAGFTWNFSGHCLDCDSYYENYLARNRSFDPLVDSPPQWWFTKEVCVDCTKLFAANILGSDDPDPSDDNDSDSVFIAMLAFAAVGLVFVYLVVMLGTQYFCPRTLPTTLHDSKNPLAKAGSIETDSPPVSPTSPSSPRSSPISGAPSRRSSFESVTSHRASRESVDYADGRASTDNFRIVNALFHSAPLANMKTKWISTFAADGQHADL